MKRYIAFLLALALLAGCRAPAGASPRSTESTAAMESPTPTAEPTPTPGLTPTPEPDWEGMLAHLEPGDIRSILRDTFNDSITPESLAPLIREAMAHPVEHRKRENGDDTVWDINLTLASDWQDGNVTLHAGLEEDLLGGGGRGPGGGVLPLRGAGPGPLRHPAGVSGHGGGGERGWGIKLKTLRIKNTVVYRARYCYRR